MRSLLSTTIACVLALGLPVIAGASEPGPPAQLPAADGEPLDAATLAALGITESPAAAVARSARPVAPESGTWSWTPGQYSYDGSGNITAIGTEASFFYDTRGRLVDANLTRSAATEHREYVYDAFGNRTSMNVGSSSIPTTTSASTNHLTGLSAVYDAAGNVTQLQPPGQSTIYQQKFDALSSLQEVKAANVSGTPAQLHIYTAGDERLWTFDLAANASHWKLRDLQGKVVRDYYVPGTNWSLSRDYIYRDGALLAAVTPTETLHFSLDHLGTPRVITGAGRNRLGFHHYLPFGEEWTDQSGAQEGEPMKFTGHERDPDAVSGGGNGFDYMHARYYSANVGRFLSLDPAYDIERVMHNPQGWNRYSYVENNPTNFTDPNGKCINVGACAWQIGRWLGPMLIREAGSATVSTLRTGTQMYAMQRLSGFTYAQPAVVPAALSEAQDGSAVDTGEESGAQDKKLTGAEVDALEEGSGESAHEIKKDTTGDKNVSKYDLYKDKDGNIYVKPKNNPGRGEPTGYNINDFFRDVW